MRRLLLLVLFLVGLWAALSNFKGLANKGEYSSIVLDFRDNLPTTVISEQLQAIAQKYNKTATLNSIFSVSDNIYTLEGDEQLLKALRHSPLKKFVKHIEPNYIYRAFEVPNDPDYGKQWNLRSINIEQAWEDTKGAGVTVAVIDTGVSRVPDLQQTEFVEGYDFVNDKVNAADDNGHGTHVAGTIAQSTNNNYGVAGIAYKAKIMPLKVLSAGGSGTISDIAEAIRFAADKGADVINMSLGGGGESLVMKEAIDYAHQKGVVIVAAAGNSNRNAAEYPARYPHVIGVAATDLAGKKAPYSNYGAAVDIAAPGGSNDGKILQETIDPRTNQPVFMGFQGTSMAAPHVAGVAALIKASGISNPDEVLSVLQKSARTVSEDPFNHFGAGHLDSTAAVKLALKGKITWKDFFRWLRDNGYLNPRFWIDGGVVALLPKILMVIGSYLFYWFLRNYLGWNWALNSGLILGSSGLFFLRGVYILDLPQWPFRLASSSIPELGNTIVGSPMLNPLFASALIPFLLIALLLGHPQWKWFAIGTTLGVASCLAVSAVMSPAVLWLGTGAIARIFLIVNALLCFGLAYLASQGEKRLA
ncbi:subtilisin-like serine protease [Pleurocapsa sp. PCC 7327]|uniref:S8 family peptidase n=1 Tax=Pleurocapsa sp. PCC 7327 TaxID=118163 RepID=UPI00029FB349|nr:S8 family peptidase [Pleurocapsa sp. PCC 7327]AFY78939.1 subtilisin-like serine protease [Pleurocapsa sp. PCC 7327]